METARAVFLLLDVDGAQLEDALAALKRPDVVTRFAIVEMLEAEPRSMHVAVRGQVSVGIEGTTATRLSGPGEGTWITGEARGVSSLWLSLDDHKPEGDLLPLRRGVVRTHAVVAESVPEGFVQAVAARPVADDEHVAPEIEPEIEPEVESEVEPEPTVSTGPSTLRVDLNEWMNDEGAQRWILRLPDGNELDAEGTIVIGRKFWEPGPEETLVKHVSAPSPKRQISGSHLELALVDGELVARDLDSTNGTIVLTPERPPRLLHGGRTTSLQTGDILDLGESFRIVVSNKR